MTERRGKECKGRAADKGKAAGTGGRSGRPLWYAEGLQFECRQCGKCCGGEPGYIWLSAEEIRSAAGAMGMHVLDFCTMYVAEYDRGFSLREMENGDCCLLKDGKCGIYSVRPLQCRTWPWWSTNLSSPAAWQQTGRRCPGVGQGRKWTPGEIARQRDQLKI